MTQQHPGLAERAESLRAQADVGIDPVRRGELGQFMTTLPVARFMATLFTEIGDDVTLLDPGAGVGSLTSAFVDEALARIPQPSTVDIEAWEIDPELCRQLERILEECSRASSEAGIQSGHIVHQSDFVQDAVDGLSAENTLFARQVNRYSHCIMNPPYRKISSESRHRAMLRSVGVETGNLYTAFLALAVMLLRHDGQLVAIVPRSFCNGVYFRSFRRFFLSRMAIRRLHVFAARDQAFCDNDVLQENIILYAVRGAVQGAVTISASTDATLSDMTVRRVEFREVVDSYDPDQVINIAPSATDALVTERIRAFPAKLTQLGIDVSTGPLVDFRHKNDLRATPGPDTYPLLYASHFSQGWVEWPRLDARKPNAVRVTDATTAATFPNGWYTVTRRFSAKEEKRRVVAGVQTPDRVMGDRVVFENHLNVFHAHGRALDALVAKGLAVYLNSSLVDMHFRQFSGHTQVNAADLRAIPYPDLSALRRLGTAIDGEMPAQGVIDNMVEEEISKMNTAAGPDPVKRLARIHEAMDVLAQLGLPKSQRNERSALTLLALLDLASETPWTAARDPLMGITPIMEFAREQYGSQYAPNTRETFRRQTMHQFLQAWLADINPDDPGRPVNSPDTVYQVRPEALELLRSYGTDDWAERVREYVGSIGRLSDKYSYKRDVHRVPVVVRDSVLQLSPGRHSQLIKAIIEDFGSIFAPEGLLLYVGDTGDRLAFLDRDALSHLGLVFDEHGKLPDVVILSQAHDRLYLVEAVTSHGPVDAKRHVELAELFASASLGLVYVTAFADRSTMARYLNDISWETEVWVADAPSHLIHFDGQRFMGPYEHPQSEHYN